MYLSSLDETITEPKVPVTFAAFKTSITSPTFAPDGTPITSTPDTITKPRITKHHSIGVQTTLPFLCVSHENVSTLNGPI